MQDMLRSAFPKCILPSMSKPRAALCCFVDIQVLERIHTSYSEINLFLSGNRARTFVCAVTIPFVLALGLNLLDPVSCRGLFALFALARRRAGTGCLPLPGTPGGTHTAYLYCNRLRRPLDDPPDDPPCCVDRWTTIPRSAAARNLP